MPDNWRQTARSIDLNVSRAQAWAFDYLTAKGLRFCVDFGTDNAIYKALTFWITVNETVKH